MVLLTVMNLRGVKESGRAFAVPTYGFVAIVFVLLIVAGVRLAMGETLTAESASYGLVADHRTGGLLTVFLALRAFASGCTALTGVEAVSNGVPSFEEPKSRNAATTLAIMGGLAVTMFAGITALAVVTQVHMAEDTSRLVGFPAGQEQRTALSQIGLAVFGSGPAFYLLQACTAAILVLAANTAYNGFPVLASLLARDGHLPRQLARRGDRLVFSNGIVLLAAVAGLLIVAFDADVTRLIQLYIIGVFVSFTLSQAGMVRHWSRELRHARPTSGPAGGCAARRRSTPRGRRPPAVVLVLVLVTKFVHGAWIVVIAMPLLYALMLRIRRHYDTADAEAAPRPGGVTLPSRIHAVVPVVKINEPTLRTLAFARAHPPRRPVGGHRARRPVGDRRAVRRVGPPRHPGAADGDREPVPGHHRAADRAPPLDPPPVAARRRVRLHPRVRRRALVGGAPAQPDRAPAEGAAAVPARCDGHERALAARAPARR